MRIATSIFAVCVGIAMTSGAYAQDKNVNLSAKFDKGSTYVYQANFQNWFEAQKSEEGKSGQSSQAGQSSTEPGKSGQSAQSGTSGYEGSSSSMMGKAIEFRMNVEDSKSNDHTIKVDMSRANASSAAGSSASSSSTSSSGQTATAGESFGTLTAHVDDNGLIKSIGGWENLKFPADFMGNKWSQESGSSGTGSSSAPSQTGQTGSERSSTQTGRAATGSEHAQTAGTSQWEMQHPYFAKFVRNQLSVMLGSGLHEKELQSGRYYYLKGTGGFEQFQGTGSPSATGTSSQGSGSTSSQSSGSPYGKEHQKGEEQSGRSTSSEYGSSSGADHHEHHNFLNTVLYRFEGTQKQGDKELARFTVLIPQKNLPMGGQSSKSSAQSGSSSSSSGQSAQTGQSDQTSKSGDSGQSAESNRAGGQTMSDQALAQAGWARVGEAYYFTKDGFLENFNIDFERAARGSFSSAEPSQFGKGPSLFIRRVTGPEDKNK